MISDDGLGDLKESKMEKKCPATVQDMITELAKKYPDRHVSITKTYNTYAHREEVVVEYSLYVNGGPECLVMLSFKKLRTHVEERLRGEKKNG